MIIGVSLNASFTTQKTTENISFKNENQASAKPEKTPAKTPSDAWKAPGENTIPAGKPGEMIRYGRELLAHTAKYFGPNGSVAAISNGMNCQNCHLDAGTRIYGNNYASFVSSFPKRLGRSGKIEPASARIAECFNRSLNGRVPDTSGKEIQAMLAYMTWVGRAVKKKEKLFGTATEKLPYLNRPADPEQGRAIYQNKCQSCHGAKGEGVPTADKKSYTYPPLWGDHSYNDGAGMYRLSNFAGFVKNNMPFGASYENPQLSNEECWDVAAFVNSQPRPHKDPKKDYPDPRDKPIDAPYGPYADAFSEQQHKYGPFAPIAEQHKKSPDKNS
ncbi:MAG: c-type cytochrome [Mucilaginibacter polytrichastri]|nr:c-type cytochrome [Mucilaginibacter polytrichastri]